jgi:AraC-like DNA-binding protein
VPWGKNLTFTDPFPYQAAIRAADLELLPTARGEFHAELTQVVMKQLWMQRFYQRLPQVNTGTVKPGRRVIGFLADANSPTLRHCGMQVSAGDIVVNDTDVIHQRTEAGLHYGSMSLPLEVFDAFCRSITGRDFSGDTRLIQPGPELMSRLLNLHKMAGHIAKTDPHIFALPEAVRALEQELIHVMVRCVTEGTSTKMTDGVRRHDMIVARFEEFLEANPNTPLYLSEICTALGTAERTLRIACEKHLGMGPIRYLTLRRMHLARRALLQADASTATVTQIVTDHGFLELGRFAVTYRALFGETPSMSLQRPPDDRQIFLNRPSSLASTGFAASHGR